MYDKGRPRKFYVDQTSGVLKKGRIRGTQNRRAVKKRLMDVKKARKKIVPYRNLQSLPMLLKNSREFKKKSCVRGQLWEDFTQVFHMKTLDSIDSVMRSPRYETDRPFRFYLLVILSERRAEPPHPIFQKGLRLAADSRPRLHKEHFLRLAEGEQRFDPRSVFASTTGASGRQSARNGIGYLIKRPFQNTHRRTGLFNVPRQLSYYRANTSPGRR
ncbi:hypothetical protein EVAR_25421_1 [Eumeta japonica]|uniref:Uncharacterized protein n=1 Tax=Eumeta variegata TaxID=151549 RepID=A0A4C1V5N1_EUMVA|nr:hypothetical protein EVAR_25421_1 [Eumeta japonica]